MCLHIDGVILVDRRIVGDDGEVDVGREHAGKEVKIVVVDETEE